MRLCCFSLKGGVGRTTLSLNLAGCYARNPRLRVLVNDRDKQNSCVAFAALADEMPFTVSSSRSPGFDIEIMDMRNELPNHEAIPEADLYLVPTLLDDASFVVFLRTVEVLENKGKRYLPIANQTRKKLIASQRVNLADPKMAGAVIVRDRAALKSYYGKGQTVFSMQGKWVPEAQQDIYNLALRVRDTLKRGDGKGRAAA